MRLTLASGLYALGEYTVRYTAQDHSGNVAECSFTFVVKNFSMVEPRLCPASNLSRNSSASASSSASSSSSNLLVAVIGVLGALVFLLAALLVGTWLHFKRQLRSVQATSKSDGPSPQQRGSLQRPMWLPTMPSIGQDHLRSQAPGAQAWQGSRLTGLAREVGNDNMFYEGSTAGDEVLYSETAFSLPVTTAAAHPAGSSTAGSASITPARLERSANPLYESSEGYGGGNAEEASSTSTGTRRVPASSLPSLVRGQKPADPLYASCDSSSLTAEVQYAPLPERNGVYMDVDLSHE